ERIWGREYDFVESPSGRRYHGEFLMYFFEDLRARGVPVQQFQVIQHDADRLEVAVILPGGAGEEERVGRELEDRLPGMKISVRRVDAIERAPSGKMHIIQNPWLRRRDAARQGACACPSRRARGRSTDPGRGPARPGARRRGGRPRCCT